MLPVTITDDIDIAYDGVDNIHRINATGEKIEQDIKHEASIRLQRAGVAAARLALRLVVAVEVSVSADTGLTTRSVVVCGTVLCASAVLSLCEVGHAIQVAAEAVSEVSGETGEWIHLLLSDQHDEQHDGEDGEADAPAGAADRIVALENGGDDTAEQGLKHEHDATGDDSHEERLGVTVGPLLPDEVQAAADEAVAGELHDVQDEVQEAVYEVYETVIAEAEQILDDAEEGSDGAPDLRHGKQHREDQ